MSRTLHRTGVILAILLVSTLAPGMGVSQEAPDAYDPEAALDLSQAAVGDAIGDFAFTDSDGNPVRLSDYRGRPVLISMIFTSCHMVCPAVTRHLDTAVQAAREALGDGSFQVITVGFDTPVDTPEAMRLFAKRQGIDDPNWAFLSGTREDVRRLMERIGFVYFPSPRGFDHINQVTVVDRDGVVYRQVYGAAFDLPWLVEPLKELVYNRPQPNEHFAVGLLNRIKLFCTVYDPNTGRYRFDYSLFVGMAVGGLIILAVVGWLVSDQVRKRRGGSTGNA
jgi:protein SCO1/2